MTPDAPLREALEQPLRMALWNVLKGRGMADDTCFDVIRKTLAEPVLAASSRASSSVAGEWQPIESAPVKHLSRFLAYATPRSDNEQMVYEVTRYDDQWGKQIRLNDGYGSYQERDILKRITHWMPLPSPPHGAGIEGGGAL